MKTNDKSFQETDILIVGSGLTGALLAIALSNVGFRVMIIDRITSGIQTSADFDGRASAIAASSKQMLCQLGLWSSLEVNSTPIKEIRVVDQSSPLFLHFDSKEVTEEALGFMVENRHLRRACFDKIIGDTNINYLAPSELGSFENKINAIDAETDSLRIRAKLIVGADGRGSSVRRLSGISIVSKPYDQTAIVLTVKHELSHHNVAYEHFFPAGPFAILPLGGYSGDNNLSSVVWTERTEAAEKLLSLGCDEFNNEFKRRFGEFHGKLTLSGPRWSYPLSSQYAQKSVTDRIALVGDAAHSIHPIAGQGLNLGFRDVAALAEILADSARLGLDIGDISVLSQYQKWRRFDNTMMLLLTDGFNRLFSNSLKPIKFCRDVGLATVNRTQTIKRFAMKHAMGCVGSLPRLLKGEPI